MVKTNKNEKRFLVNAGISSDHVMKSINSSIGLDDGINFAHNFVRRFTDTFFKLNLQTYGTKIAQQSQSIVIAKELFRESVKNYNDINIYLKNFLKLAGIKEIDWQVLKYLRRYGIIDSTLCKKIPIHIIEEILHKTGKEKIPHNISTYRFSMANKINSFYQLYVNHALITPDLETKMLTNFGTNPGSFIGEMVRSIMQFKSYGVAITQKLFNKMINFQIPFEEQTDSITRLKSLFEKKNTDLYTNFFQYITLTMCLGYLTNCIVLTLKNKDIPPI